MQKLKKLICFFAILFIYVTLLVSCKSQNMSVEKIRDLDFTVVEVEEVPVELKDLIEEKKGKPFKLSYSDSKFLYIVVGYGEQTTGGYSITVEDLYLTKNAIYINTNLVGPEKDEMVTQAITYPYIVVKTEFLDVSIVFE